MTTQNQIVIIGAGPSGLYCALKLLEYGYKVSLYEKGNGIAKKFLIAGSSGLNITHSEDLESFSSKYGDNKDYFRDIIKKFSPEDLRSWCKELGIETFVGSSGRVFPKTMTGAEILTAWKNKLSSYDGFKLHTLHEFIAIEDSNTVKFRHNKNIVTVEADLFVLTLGGASWAQTGSDGRWKSIMEEHDVEIATFLPSNCGFNTDWSQIFREKVDHTYLKNIKVTYGTHFVRSECMLTPYGIEGSAIYALSRFIRDDIIENKKSTIYIDLCPDLSHDEIVSKLEKPRGKNSLSNHLRKVLTLDKNKLLVLNEVLSKDEMQNLEILSKSIKTLPIVLKSTRDINEAISTSGGVTMAAVDEHLRIKTLDNFYVAGEMVDWEAPTGGYLLQGCFSMAHDVAQAIDQRLKLAKS